MSTEISAQGNATLSVASMPQSSARPGAPAPTPVEAVKAALPAEAASPRRLEQAVENLNRLAQSMRRDLHFSVDEASGHTVVKVMDAESGETVRQIPSEEVLSMARHLADTAGLILRTKA